MPRTTGSHPLDKRKNLMKDIVENVMFKFDVIEASASPKTLKIQRLLVLPFTLFAIFGAVVGNITIINAQQYALAVVFNIIGACIIVPAIAYMYKLVSAFFNPADEEADAETTPGLTLVAEKVEASVVTVSNAPERELVAA